MNHEGWNPEAVRARLHSFVPYTGAGIVVTYVADDASEIRVEMPLTDANVNLVGTHFGGSLYAMVDPHLMVLLMGRLGPDYVVWDKAANIEFQRPGVGTVRATISVTDAEIVAIRAATANGDKYLPQWMLSILDEKDEVVATVLKTLYVRRKRDD